ncbi:Glycosyl hydrolases family 18-domain-containing protein [Mycena kentingensis (nom. inval.)]|nr:Glycosyl hydrolases family 18-domain-containing protein [Mycena kentingensis (nom. inval.)]
MKLFLLAAVAAAATTALAASVRRDPEWLILGEGVAVSSANDTQIAMEKRAGTEVTHCYNAGTAVRRDKIIPLVDEFCARNKDVSVSNGQTVWTRYGSADGTFTVLISGSAINGCNFLIDNNCGRLLRMPLDNCNTNTVTAKQCGYETDSCGQWRVDPGSNGSDF